MTAVEPTAPAPAEVLRKRVQTRGDAIWELVRIRAFQALLKGYESEVRDWLAARLLETERQEGTDAACRVKGAGRAHVTKPTTRWVPNDQRELAAWASAHRPAEVSHRLRVDAARVDAWLNAAGADPGERARRADAVRELLGDRHAVRDDRTVSEDLAERLAAEFELTPEGLLVDPTSGEALPVRQITTSARTFAFTPDAGVVGHLVEQLHERVLQALPAPGDPT